MPNGNADRRLLESLKTVVREREVPILKTPVDDNEEDAQRFDRHVAAELEAIKAQEPGDLWEIVSAASRIEGERGLASIASKFIRPPVRALTATVSDGCRLIGTPYDHDWQVGLGTVWTRLDGKAFALGPDDGESGSGFAIDLMSNTELDAVITPMGDYNFSAFATADMPALRSRGGLGVTAFEDGQEVFKRIVQLFVFNRPQGFSGVGGEGLVADAASPTAPGMFGPVTLAPVFLRLHPGQRLQVWMWAWVITSGADGAWAAVSFNVPAVRVCAGPPVVIH